MRIAMFGGSFDPVHHGHLILAEQCREQAQLDQVWFVPCQTSPLKPDGPRASNRQRLAMLQLAVGGHEPFQVSELELHREGVSYTVETLTAIRDQHPDAELCFVIGGDSVDEFHLWKSPEKIVELAQPLIVPRPGSGALDPATLQSKLPAGCQPLVIQQPLIEISSTDLRDRCQNGRSLRYLTPRSVEMYLATQRVYASAT